jgi:hypothetical protein
MCAQSQRQLSSTSSRHSSISRGLEFDCHRRDRTGLRLARNLNQRPTAESVAMSLIFMWFVRSPQHHQESKARRRSGLFHACPKRQCWRGFPDMCEGRQQHKTPDFGGFSALCALCSLFLRRAPFAQPPVFMRLPGREYEREFGRQWRLTPARQKRELGYVHSWEGMTQVHSFQRRLGSQKH